MLSIVRHNFSLKLLALAIAIVGWAYFRFTNNPFITARFDQQVTIPITAANLPPGYIARFNEKEAVVTIDPKRGDPPIKPDEIKAVLDLSSRDAGVYNVPVQLVAPNVAVQSLSPASVTLTVERLESRSFPVAVHYGGAGNVVVNSYTLTPNVVSVRGPSSDLAQVAAVDVDLPLLTGKPNLDEMVRPVAVTSSGDLIRDVQVTPNLVRVQASFLPAQGR